MTTDQVERWRRALEARISRRRFRPDDEDPEVLAGLEAHCAAFRPLGPARATLVRRAPPGLFRGIVGSYGRIRGALSCLVMAGSADGAEAVGFVGQAAVLEVTALGLGTCWVGGLFDPVVAAGLIDLRRGERVFAVSPVGRPAGEKRLGERLMAGIARSRSRKGPAEIAPGIEGGCWPPWAVAGVGAARRAPSALNRQPWRFRLEGDRVVLAVDGPDTYRIPKRLDCGIAMLHFELGARAAGDLGRWDLRRDLDVAAYGADPTGRCGASRTADRRHPPPTPFNRSG